MYIDQLCQCGHSRAAHRHNAAGMLDGECMCGGCAVFLDVRPVPTPAPPVAAPAPVAAPRRG